MNEENKLEVQLRARLDNLTERLCTFTRQSNELYDQTKKLASVFHDKQRRLYHIEDHLLRLQGKPGLSELYLENGSQPRRLTKDLEELHMGVKTLRRKFQATGNVIITSGWWRHLKVDTSQANKDIATKAETSVGTKNGTPLSPSLPISSASHPSARSSRSTFPLEKIFALNASPTSVSFSQSGIPASLLSQNGSSKDPSPISPISAASGGTHFSLGLRSPPLTPRTTSIADLHFKGHSPEVVESKTNLVLPNMCDHEDAPLFPVTKLCATRVDEMKASPLSPETHGTVTGFSALQNIKVTLSLVNTASEAEVGNIAFHRSERHKGVQQDGNSDSTAASERQSHCQDDHGEHLQEDKEVDTHDVGFSAGILPALTPSSNGNTEPSHSPEEWLDTEGDSALLQKNYQVTASKYPCLDQSVVAQTLPQDSGWTQRLKFLLARMKYLLLGTAALGVMLPHNLLTFCMGFASVATFGVLLIGSTLFGRNGGNTKDRKQSRDIFAFGHSTTLRLRTAATISPSHSPTSTVSRRHHR